MNNLNYTTEHHKEQHLTPEERHDADQSSSVFKTITADSGSEFAELSLSENGETKVYFTHPYSAFEICLRKRLTAFMPHKRGASGATCRQPPLRITRPESPSAEKPQDFFS